MGLTTRRASSELVEGAGAVENWALEASHSSLGVTGQGMGDGGGVTPGRLAEVHALHLDLGFGLWMCIVYCSNGTKPWRSCTAR